MFERNPIYPVFGIITGTAGTIQLPTGSCLALKFKADPDNNDDFLIGDWVSNLPLYPLAPGDETDWIYIDDLNKFVCSAISGSLDYMYYFLLR